jgi:D-arabinose 1-dehydrogenase-like Zn-dependent alcohol dehydrogenase
MTLVGPTIFTVGTLCRPRGDEVFAVCETGQEGAYAEKIAIKAAIVAKKPTSLSHVEIAGVALTGLTALSAIEDTLKLKRGETILIGWHNSSCKEPCGHPRSSSIGSPRRLRRIA